MQKLRLQLEDLRIESFTTTSSQKEKGTVFGEQCTCPTACSCPGCPTCDASCNGTCGATCAGTCDASCNGTCDWSCNTCGGSCGGAGDSCYQTCALYSGCTPYACW